MSSDCNGTTINTTCENGQASTQLFNLTNRLTSDVTPGPQLDNSTVSPDENHRVWIPYLSLLGLLFVSVTLGFSFFSHWKRVKRRKNNLQDYLDHDIDLKRKRLYGMMRMPYDLDRVPSFSRSLDDSRHMSSLNFRYKSERQSSYDFFPNKGDRLSQRGGFQRTESMNGPMPSIRIDGQEYHDDEWGGYEKELCNSKKSCRQHCVVSCKLCWKNLRGELFTLLKTCIDDLYTKSDRDNAITNQYSTPSSVPFSESGVESMKKSTQSSEFDDNNRDEWINRCVETKKKREESFEYKSSLPSMHKQRKDNILKRQKKTEGSNDNELDRRKAFDGNGNRLTSSDSELFEPRRTQESSVNSSNRRFNRLSESTNNIGIPDVISSKQTLNHHNFSVHFHDDLSAENVHVITDQNQSKTVTVYGTTNQSHLAKTSPMVSLSRDDINIMPQISSPYFSPIEPINYDPQDRSTFYQVNSPTLSEHGGGIINYGFQSDSVSSQYDLNENHSSFSDIKSTDVIKMYNQRSEVRNNERSNTSRSKAKRKYPLLKSLKHFDLSTSSNRQTSFQSPERETISLQNRHPPAFPRDHRIDLSVIDVSYKHFSHTDSLDGYTQSDSSHRSSHHDVNV